MRAEPKVVVAAGGTAGHVVPAMAVADELRARGAEVSFLGTRERIGRRDGVWRDTVFLEKRL